MCVDTLHYSNAENKGGECLRPFSWLICRGNETCFSGRPQEGTVQSVGLSVSDLYRGDVRCQDVWTDVLMFLCGVGLIRACSVTLRLPFADKPQNLHQESVSQAQKSNFTPFMCHNGFIV